jgi:peptidoglycan/LPS O-acetylase OafA/YrhL
MVLLSSVVVFRSGLFGQFGNPSIFVAAAHLFLVGIASRLWLKDLQNFVVPPLFAACALMFGLIFREVMWLAIWVALMAYFVSKEQWRAAGYTMLLKAIYLALESPVARYMGARSYSVYLLHTSVIELTIWAIGTAKPDVMRPEIFLAVLVIAPPLIAVASDLLYRWIEHPLTLFGGRLARRKETVTKLPDKRGESLGV